MDDSKVYTITEAKAQLSKLVRLVKSGKEIILGSSGQPEIVLIKFEKDPVKRKIGVFKKHKLTLSSKRKTVVKEPDEFNDWYDNPIFPKI